MQWEIYGDINSWIKQETEKIQEKKVLPPATSAKRQLDIMLQEQRRYEREYRKIQESVLIAENVRLEEIKVPPNELLQNNVMEKNIKYQHEWALTLQKKKEQTMQLYQQYKTAANLRKMQLDAQYKDFQKNHL